MKVDEVRDPSETQVVESASGLDVPNLKEPPPLPRGLNARLKGERVRHAREGEQLGRYRAVICCRFGDEPDH